MGVVTRAGDEPGVTPMLETLPDDVEARCGGPAADLADAAVGPQHGNPQERVVGVVAGRAPDGGDPLGRQVEPSGRWPDDNPTAWFGRQQLAVPLAVGGGSAAPRPPTGH